MDEIMPAEQAQLILARHQRKEKLCACVKGAWKQWEELGQRSPDLLIPVGPSARAFLMHNYMTDLARKEFTGEPGARLGVKNGLLILTFDDQLVLRFEKFRNGNFTTSGIPTRQYQEYAYQQLSFEGMPSGATKLVVGYLLDKLQTSIETVAVACSIGSDLLWVVNITGEADTGTEGMEPPSRGDDPSGPRVGPKPSEQQDDERSRQ